MLVKLNINNTINKSLVFTFSTNDRNLFLKPVYFLSINATFQSCLLFAPAKPLKFRAYIFKSPGIDSLKPCIGINTALSSHCMLKIFFNFIGA